MEKYFSLVQTIAIFLIILKFSAPCCVYKIPRPPPIKECCCCCDYGWGYNSGWPPEPGCNKPNPGDQWGAQKRVGRGNLHKKPPGDIPSHRSIPIVKPPTKQDPRPTFLATIATAYERPVCSATIISVHFVLSTCVRCLHDNGTAVNPAQVRVMVVDSADDKNNKHNFIVYETQTISLHPGCVNNGTYNLIHDIGLVQTIDEIKFSSNIGPAKLPNNKFYKPSITDDWMLASYSAEKSVVKAVSDAVTFVKLSSVNLPACTKVLNSTFYNETFNYCAPYHNNGRMDSCEDDFGATLAIDNTVYGLLIHKFHCGKPGSAASFVSVSYNNQWIRKAVKELSDGNEVLKK